MSGKKKKDYDYQFKVVVIGDTGVGKSSILKRFVDRSFTPTGGRSTLDVDFKHRIIHVGKHRVKLNIWDTAGQEQYNTITTAYYRGAEGIIIVYDVTNQSSLKHVGQWVNEVERYSNEGAAKLVAANKMDLARGGQGEEQNPISLVPGQEGTECAKSLGALFFETSALDGTDIDRAFEALAVKLIEVKGGPSSRDSRTSTAVRLDDISVAPDGSPKRKGNRSTSKASKPSPSCC